jgi:ribonuclease HII
MLKIIATDEAGYGPPLGPLVITATEWNVDSAESFSPFLQELETTGFSIGDSKKIYHSGGSLAALETVVLGALQSIMKTPENIRKSEYFKAGWSNPLITNIAAVFDSAAKKSTEKTGCSLCGVRSRIIEPAEFNELLDRFQSKGTLLSESTMQLIRFENCTFNYPAHNADTNFTDAEITGVKIICDKHGGRNKYLALLQHYYPDEMFSIKCESTAKSIYKSGKTKYPLEVSFIAKGESETPVALSSMFSKYLRERAMLQFNAFWKQHIPNLKPTAGYPEDAVRFLRDIKDKQIELGIPDNELRRKK